MPNYEFQKLSDNSIHCIFFKFSDAPAIGSVIEYESEQYKRIASVPYASQDTVIDPYSEKDFVRATNKKGGTFGELFDRSAELSKIREQKDGVDKISEKTKKEYNQFKDALEPPKKQKEAALKNLKRLGVSIKEKNGKQR